MHIHCCEYKFWDYLLSKTLAIGATLGKSTAPLPGDVEQDEAFNVGQLHILLVHLQPDVLVEVTGVAQLLQAHLHVDALVV